MCSNCTTIVFIKQWIPILYLPVTIGVESEYNWYSSHCSNFYNNDSCKGSPSLQKMGGISWFINKQAAVVLIDEDLQHCHSHNLALMTGMLEDNVKGSLVLQTHWICNCIIHKNCNHWRVSIDNTSSVRIPCHFQQIYTKHTTRISYKGLGSLILRL